MTYYPYVESPITVLKKLNRNVNELSFNQLKNLKLQPGQIVIVRLDDARDNEDRENMLMRHDNMIYTNFKKLIMETKDVIVMYTGMRSSWVMLSEADSETNIRQRRETTGNEPATNVSYVFINATFARLYVYNNSILNITEAGKTKSYSLVACKENIDETKLEVCLNETSKTVR